MIKIPVCFSCIHYSFENKTCPAHPEGVPGNVLVNKKSEVKDCGNGIKFEDSFKNDIETQHRF